MLGHSQNALPVLLSEQSGLGQVNQAYLLKRELTAADATPVDRQGIF